MKRIIIFSVCALLMLGGITSCSVDEIEETFPTYSTGDEIDEHAEPDEGA